MGMKGEVVYDDSIWVVKSHYPLVVPNCGSFRANKTFICVRNPLDVLPSYANLVNTLSHGNKLSYELHEECPEWWSWWVKKQTFEMKRFFKVLIDETITQGTNPLYIVRYEDLVLQPKETLMSLFCFLLDADSLEDTTTERRIDEVVAMGKGASAVYNLKSTTGLLNMHESKYSPELRSYVQSELAEMIHYFGYAKVDGQENPTGFFEFPEAKPEFIKLQNKFRMDSE